MTRPGEVQVKATPALLDRLRIQALLRDIVKHRGEAEMLEILRLALNTEFRYQDKQNEKDRIKDNQ